MSLLGSHTVVHIAQSFATPLDKLNVLSDIQKLFLHYSGLQPLHRAVCVLRVCRMA